MQSRTIVSQTLRREYPLRVARSFHDSDVVGVCHEVETPATDWRETATGRWERLDEWGNTWTRLGPTSKGEVTTGVLDDLSRMDAISFPEFSRPAYYASAGAARVAHPDKYLLGLLPGFAFNIARKLRRLDQYLVDLLADMAALHELHDRIDNLIVDMLRNYAAQGMDGVFFAEDWGTQQQLLMSPALWHEEFEPRFQRLCGIARQLGLSVWMHSCGNIAAIIPALARAGIDVMQFDQPELHGLDRLAAYQDAFPITFWCPVDVQKVLPTGDEALIRNHARIMLEKLWRGGGFIAGHYPDGASIGVDPAWQEAACDAFMQYGVAQRRGCC